MVQLKIRVPWLKMIDNTCPNWAGKVRPIGRKGRGDVEMIRWQGRGTPSWHIMGGLHYLWQQGDSAVGRASNHPPYGLWSRPVTLGRIFRYFICLFILFVYLFICSFIYLSWRLSRDRRRRIKLKIIRRRRRRSRGEGGWDDGIWSGPGRSGPGRKRRIKLLPEWWRHQLISQ